METNQDTIALYHPFRLNRAAVIKLLSNEFNCSEIEHWKDIQNSVAKTIVVVSPELLLLKVSVSEMMDLFWSLKKRIIVITYNEEFKIMGRKNVSVLYKPSVDEFFRKLKVKPIRKFLNELNLRITA